MIQDFSLCFRVRVDFDSGPPFCFISNCLPVLFAQAWTINASASAAGRGPENVNGRTVRSGSRSSFPTRPAKCLLNSNCRKQLRRTEWVL
eukprot:767617-Hanusia_phi.AAC.2